MRIATFNVQNMRLRQDHGWARLDGARDGDAPDDSGPGAAALDPVDRRLTAAVLARADADVVALQEVFDAETLDHFYDYFLRPAGLEPYPHRICLPGNDGRGLDLALLSRPAPLAVHSHAAETPDTLGLRAPPGIAPGRPVFRRDCLEVALPALTLFVCHFKAPYPDAEDTRAIRRLEAAAVRTLIARRFADHAGAMWMVLGDLNTARRGDAPANAPLAEMAEDLVARCPAQERWSYHDSHGDFYTRPDAMLASPALAARFPEARPRILRHGMGREAARYTGPRLGPVGDHRPHASDHAALVIDLPGL
ncbi:Exonuclease III [Salinihabitans flavidus]|uniref:Exonuclease III n=1 Tax=Salinihabitans flavidus TaxID=569882 RepID=A0A1H8V5F0_9RHOB|nr:endonuclease/exonuclease/phosphatase family protein [Salinihabitans flavidus]SEP10473.1 Exonuclease III [Salinihabitans flavidus]